MTTIFNGCSFGEIFISPKNWKTTTAKASLQKSWFVQTRFHDPNFPKYNPKGFPYRRKINKDTTSLDERRAVAEFVRAEMESVLKQGYNPITNTFTTEPQARKDVPAYTSETALADALDLAFSISEYTGEVRKDVERVVKYIKISLTDLGFENMQVGKFLGVHLKLALENMKVIRPGFTDKRYNRFIANLSPMFKILKGNGLITINPCEGIGRKSTIVDKREILTVQQRIKIDNHLKANYPSFWLFTNLFYHTSGREIELLSAKFEDIDLDNLTYHAYIKKGGLNMWIARPIKKIAVPFWEKAMINAKKGDYLFSVGLMPGTQKIRRDQVTRRWKTHVKEKLEITADFYSLKHSNLTEIAERTSAKDAARAAGHVNDRMVRKHYDVTIEQREMNNVRSMTNAFAPEVKNKHEGEVCAPMAFALQRNAF